MSVKVTTDGRRRRRWRLVIGAVALAVIAAVAAPIIYLRQQAGELEQVPVNGLTPPTSPSTVPGSSPGGVPDTKPPALSAPINVLVVGVDARANGEVSGSRTDTIAVVRLDPNGPRLTVLSIPRDLYVPIDGGGENRINSALAKGRDALVNTVSETLGVDINHYMEVDFSGFSRLVDLAGGVDVAFDAPVRDRNTGFMADAGCVHLNGDQALAYVRSRHFQTYDAESDTWVTDRTSDLGRISRQQDFGVRVVEQVLASSYGRLDQVRILTDVVDDVTVDEGLSIDGLRAIWNTAADAGRDGTTLLTLNDVVSNRRIDGADVLVADSDAVREIAAPLRGEAQGNTDDPSAAEPPGSGPATTAPAATTAPSVAGSASPSTTPAADVNGGCPVD